MQESTRRRPRGGGTVYRVGERWRGSIFVRDEDGQRRRQYVSGDSQADALAKLRTAQADADEAAARAKAPTLAWWATRWLGSARLRVRPATLRAYRRAMVGHVLPALGDRPLVDLRSADVEALLGRLVDGGMAPSTAALTRRVLVACLADAERDGRIARNVARSARPPRVEPVDRRRLTAAEVRALLALSAEDPRTDVLVALGIGTGARIGELCALDWSDIDLDAGTVTIRGTVGRGRTVGPPKSHRGRRIVALPTFAIEALRRDLARRPGASGPVLADSAGRRLIPERASERWRELRARAGLDDVRFHDLRGTAATMALAAGVTPTEVARSLGHDPAVLMRTYAGAIPGGRALVAEAIERAIDG
jgi:integrase